MSGFEFPPNKSTDAAFSEAQPLLTVDDLINRYLFGIELKDYKTGKPIPTETLQHFISTSVSYLEHKLDIIIMPRTFTERYDYNANDYENFSFIQLKKRPVSEIVTMKAKFANNQELIDYPKSWFVLEPEAGQMQLTPVQGTFSGLVVSQSGSSMPLMFGQHGQWPHLFEIVYKAGFCADQIPILINDMIGMQASIRVFEIMGDILFGPGVASESVGLDGANVSRSTTAAAAKTIFSARIDNYKAQVKEYIDTTKKYYNGIPFVIA